MREFIAWIEIGRTGALYTLHRKLVGRPEHPHAKIYTYVRNLGRTWDTACKNADKWLDQNPCDHIKEYDISDEGGTLRKPGQYGDDRLWFGKHEGKLIADLLEDEKGREYLLYIRDNFTSTKPRMKSLLTALEDLNLGKSKAEIRLEERKKRDAELESLLRPIPHDLAEGRHTFTGEILGHRSEPDGFGGSVTKIIFLDDRGFKLWGTCPSAFWQVEGKNEYNEHTILSYRDEIRGLRVQFDATLQISDRDDKFGFTKRPTKAIVLSESTEGKS